MNTAVAGVGEEAGVEGREGGREKQMLTLRLDQGHVREVLHQKLRMFERLKLGENPFPIWMYRDFYACVYFLVISGVFWMFLSRSL